MKRIPWLWLLFSIYLFILSACASELNSTPTAPVVYDPIIPETPTSEISCSSITAEPTSAPSSESLFPPVSGADFSTGPADAPITIIEYCDFQSPGCNAMAAVIGELMRNHDNVLFVFRPLPLIGILDKSDKAVIAALAADEQDKFWEMYDLLFVKHPQWENLKPDQFYTWVVQEAVTLEIDGDRLQAAIKASGTTSQMMSMYDAAKQLTIPAVPLVLINGTLQQSYVLDYQSMSDSIGLIALGRKQFTECPPFDIDPKRQYIATIKTEKGDIVIQLLPDKAPLAVNSFLFLARQGWYDGVTFHRVIPGFIAQAGDPSGTGKGNPGYFFNNEISDLKFDKPGMVAMANSGPDTNGSQFFITFSTAAHLDGGYTIFGQVLSGLDIAEKLTPRDPAQGGVLTAGDKIITVEMEEK
ncbi:MAG TPA: peptidylprolyl isomerase [Anaerolineales bacterium]|nr:peptidylprolyl isomerase [Anaerolineales bacterium]